MEIKENLKCTIWHIYKFRNWYQTYFNL